MIKTCIVCGKEFDAQNRAKICSPECRAEHKRTCSRISKRIGRPLTKKNCAVCGKEFMPKAANALVCSPDCRAQYYRNYRKNKRQKPKPKTKTNTCHICGNEFIPAYFGQKYCSDECRKDYKAELMRVFFTKVVNKEFSF